MDRALSALLRRSLESDRVPHVDAAIACDRQRAHVTDMCTPDGRSPTLADGILIAGVCPAWRAVLIEMLEQLRSNDK